MASLLPETDSEDELPPGWEERTTLDGKVYYANHESKSTQWTHPRTGKKKKVAGELPFGWERQTTEDGHAFFVDHINKKTTYVDPRLAFAVEEKDSPTDIRQRFDASTSALQILHGRDLSGKVAVVTGANCGIGFETAKSLAYHGCDVYFACRNEKLALAAINKVKNERPNASLHFIPLDLSRFASILNFYKQFILRERRLHILVLNAAVMGLPHTLTEDGLEITFQVNHLGHFYLLKLFEQVLLNSAPARVVAVSSESHRFSTIMKANISEERLSPTTGKNFISMCAYNDSKLLNILFSNELNRRLSDKGVTSSALHPGNLVGSSLARNWWLYRLLYIIAWPFTKSLQQAAATSVYCATVYELEGVGGMYFNNCCRCKPSASADDADLAKTLWAISEHMIEKVLNK